MQSRWEGWLNTAERETENVKAQVRQSGGMKAQAGQLKDQYQTQYSDSGNGHTESVDVRTNYDPSLETRQI
jgi:hypothetical protein